MSVIGRESDRNGLDLIRSLPRTVENAKRWAWSFCWKKSMIWNVLNMNLKPENEPFKNRYVLLVGFDWKTSSPLCLDCWDASSVWTSSSSSLTRSSIATGNYCQITTTDASEDASVSLSLCTNTSIYLDCFCCFLPNSIRLFVHVDIHWEDLCCLRRFSDGFRRIKIESEERRLLRWCRKRSFSSNKKKILCFCSSSLATTTFTWFIGVDPEPGDISWRWFWAEFDSEKRPWRPTKWARSISCRGSARSPAGIRWRVESIARK